MRYKIKHLFFCLLVFLHCSTAQSLQVGTERTTQYFPILKDKAIGVVGNQSSLIGERTVMVVECQTSSG